MTPEIFLKFQGFIIPAHLFYHLLISLDVCPAKGINGLFGITHDKELSRFKNYLAGVFAVMSQFFRKEKDNFILDGVGVLELINEYGPELVLKLFTNITKRFILQQISGHGEKSVERDIALRQGGLPEFLCKRENEAYCGCDKCLIDGF